MRSSYENDVLRPAVLLLLGAEPDVLVHAAPVELLTASPPCRACGARPPKRARAPIELGAGTPDLLCSIRWRRGDYYSAAWLCLELKAPPCPGSAPKLFLCGACLAPPRPGVDVVAAVSLCCRARRRWVDRWSPGTVSKAQRELHAAWERAGRWVRVVRTPEDARTALEMGRGRLRAAGLVPVPVEGRPC